MEKTIELSKEYWMLLRVQYVKNVSTGKKRYEIKSKIVRKVDYLIDKDCIGEIEGEYFTTVQVFTPYTFFFKKRYKNLLKNKVRQVINRFYLRSKILVEEWELNEEVMKDVECTIEHLLESK